jgi:hypothetical protein
MTETRGLEEEPLPLPQRLWQIFRAPRRVYASVADGGNWPDWVVPVLLLAGLWALHNLASMPTEMPAWDDVPEEQREMAARGFEVWRSHGWFSLPLVTSFTMLAVVGLVLLGVARWILRAEITLRQTLAIKAYASVVTAPQWLLLMIAVRLGDRDATPLSFTPAAFLDDPESSLIGRFLGSLSLFDMWQTAVMGIGLAVMTGQPSRRTIALLVTMWLAWTALGAIAPMSSGPAPVIGP